MRPCGRRLWPSRATGETPPRLLSSYQSSVKRREADQSGTYVCSAGGNLALALTQLLLQFRRTPTSIRWHTHTLDAIPLPAAVTTNSPWLDITQSSPSWAGDASSSPFDFLPKPDVLTRGGAVKPCAAWPAAGWPRAPCGGSGERVTVAYRDGGRGHGGVRHGRRLPAAGAGVNSPAGPARLGP